MLSRQIGILVHKVIYTRTTTTRTFKMDVLPSGNIFHELQVVHDTGYYDGKVSPEEHWQQVGHSNHILLTTFICQF